MFIDPDVLAKEARRLKAIVESKIEVKKTEREKPKNKKNGKENSDKKWEMFFCLSFL